MMKTIPVQSVRKQGAAAAEMKCNLNIQKGAIYADGGIHLRHGSRTSHPKLVAARQCQQPHRHKGAMPQLPRLAPADQVL